MPQLKSGYTTGTHATAVLLACLYEHFHNREVDTLEVLLPKGLLATIEVRREKHLNFSTIKGDNDDIDVTKGAKILCTLEQHIPTNLKEQTPSLLLLHDVKLFVWAGEGVGVVTKKGLKIAPTYPAINPTPLAMMQENAQSLVGEVKEELHALFSVQDGEKIARDTANAKVGVIGGISILGTRGIVKPVSASAYIDSIEVEISVAKEFSEEVIVFTLGNSAVDVAKEMYDATSIVEIGNFVYDASERLRGHSFQKLVFITSIAKMTKVAQGFKNTHNKYGTIDFVEVREWIESELHFSLEEEEFITLKGLMQALPQAYHESFVKLVTHKSAEMMRKWLGELDVNLHHIEIVTLPTRIKEELKW